jgi:hypothetical protein
MRTSFRLLYVVVALWIVITIPTLVGANYLRGLQSSTRDDLLRFAVEPRSNWLSQSLLWDDAVDGRPSSAEEIEAGLTKLEVRLGVSSELRLSAVMHTFTTTNLQKTHEMTFKLYSGKCDASIKVHVIHELAYDEYDTINHRLGEGDIALDIGGHVGAAALQVQFESHMA